MRLAKYLIEEHPILIWSFFFGLIIASLFFVGKQITKWNLPIIISLLIGAFGAFYITTLPSLGANNNMIFLFFAGASGNMCHDITWDFRCFYTCYFRSL